MSTHKHFDKICYVVLALTLILTILFMNAERLGIQKADTVMGYEKKLFDTSTVHEINIIMDDWDDFINNCKSEEYYLCSVVIDNEAYKNVAIRGKGNTSLTQVDFSGTDRYSFKIEFDHYDDTNTYHGLDKLCLNNIIQDNTYMKDYLTYQMMAEMGAPSPLCSYAYITVNGEDWGLYLAVEAVEDSFLMRNYGNDYGELYKPDSMNMGGGRGNGKNFNMDDFDMDTMFENFDDWEMPEGFGDWQMPENFGNWQMPENFGNRETPEGFGDWQMPENFGNRETPEGFGDWQMPEGFGNREMPEGFGDWQMPENFGDWQMPENFGNWEMPEGFGNWQIPGMGTAGRNSDVLLKYIDDNFESYSNIFNSAKTDITDKDKARLIEALKNLTNGESLSDTIDMEAVIRYFVVHNFVLNFDSYTGSMVHNYYLYEEDGQMQLIPWDYNLAFGSFQAMSDATSLINYPIDSPVSGGNLEDRPMIAWIFSNETYTELYHKYFSEFITDYFESGYFETMISEVTEMISPYIEKDPTKFCSYEDFEKGISTLREFCLLRAKSIRGQLDGSIGSTSETQKNSTFVDASTIQISDMGSMANGMRGNMQGGNRPNFPGANTQESTTPNFPWADTQDGTMPNFPSSNRPGAGNFGGSFRHPK